MRTTALFAVTAATALCGCTGVDKTGPSAPEETMAPSGAMAPTPSEEAAPGEARLRLLSEFEYNQTLAQLLGETGFELGLSPSSGATPFDNDAADLTLKSALLLRYHGLAPEVARALVADGGQLPDCDANRACAETFFKEFGTRAYRRPISAVEVEQLLSVYDVGAKTSHERGLELAVEGILTSAPFLYRPEIGVVESSRRKLTGYEVAVRLSYFLWGIAPDAELLEAASAGELDELAGVTAHAKRLFAADQARVAFRHLHRQWLQVDHLDGQTRNPELGDFNAELRDGLKEETLRFLEVLLFENGTVRDIYDARFSMMNRAVAEHSGVSGPAGEAFERVDLDGDKRRGLLTHAGLLASGATFDRTSPIHRGVFVRTQLLCQTLPPPPASVPSLPDPSEGQTERERLRQHSESPECAGCHTLMDPIGFAFENYDATGRYRTEGENGLPVDTSGELSRTSAGDIPLTGVGDLSAFLATSTEAQECVARQYFRYALGRSLAEDTDRTKAIAEALGPDYQLGDLVMAVVSSDAFRYRDDFEAASCEMGGGEQ